MIHTCPLYIQKCSLYKTKLSEIGIILQGSGVREVEIFLKSLFRKISNSLTPLLCKMYYLKKHALGPLNPRMRFCLIKIQHCLHKFQVVLCNCLTTATHPWATCRFISISMTQHITCNLVHEPIIVLCQST